MGVSLGHSDKKSVNVELNVVPFVDVMSCLTLFLLAASSWVNIARLDVRPTGHARDQPACLDGACDELACRVSVGVGRHERLDDGGKNGALRTVQHGPTFVGIAARCCRSDVTNRGQ